MFSVLTVVLSVVLNFVTVVLSVVLSVVLNVVLTHRVDCFLTHTHTNKQTNKNSSIFKVTDASIFRLQDKMLENKYILSRQDK